MLIYRRAYMRDYTCASGGAKSSRGEGTLDGTICRALMRAVGPTLPEPT